MKIRILEGQLESAKEEQSLALQKSLMQKSTYEDNRKRNRISTTTSNSPKKQRTSAENSPDSVSILIWLKIKREINFIFQSNLEVSEVGVVGECSEPRDGNASCSIQ